MLTRKVLEPKRMPIHTLVSIVLICTFFFLRIKDLSNQPLFIDEAISIDIAERIKDTSPFVDAWQGRLFSIWALLPFQPHRAAPAFISRSITVFAQLVALTALVKLAQRKAGIGAALLAYLLFSFSPYHQFFHRMGLPDSFASAFQILTIALSWYWLKRPNLFRALVIGTTLFIAFGAKINSVIFSPVPLAAWLSLNHFQRTRRASRQWMLLSIFTAVVLAVVLVSSLSLIDQDLLSTFHIHRGSPASFSLARILHNAENSFNVLSSYLSLPLLIFGLLSLGYLALSRELYLPLVTLTPMLAVWSVQTQQSRFWITPTTLLLLAIAIAWGRIMRIRRGLFTFITASGLSIWLFALAFPFLINTLGDPSRLTLPGADEYQYLQGESAGLAIREVHAALLPHQPQLVLGIINNCLSLRYSSLSDFPVHCPRVNYTGEDIPKHIALMEDNRSVGVYAVLDSTPFTPSEAPGNLLGVIPSPGETILYSVYDLSPSP